MHSKYPTILALQIMQLKSIIPIEVVTMCVGRGNEWGLSPSQLFSPSFQGGQSGCHFWHHKIDFHTLP